MPPRDRIFQSCRVSPRSAGLALVGIVAVLLYLPAVWNGLAVDDVVIAAHPLLQSIRTLPAAMSSPWWYPTQHLYRPLSSGLLGILLLAGQGAPWLAHAVNVALHALVAVLVTRLCLRWLPLAASVGAGLFFAVLPAHGEAVATLVALAELLAAAALVATMLVVTRAGPPTRRTRIAVALLSAAALASKEGGVAAPVLALAAAWAYPAARPYAWRWALSALAGTAIMLTARLVVLGALGGDVPHALFRTLATGTRVVTALALLPRSAAMLFLPVRPAINYSPSLLFVQRPQVSLVVLGACMIVAGLVALAVHARRPSVWTLGLVAITALLAPTVNVLFASGVALSGRSVYAPSIGAALLVGALLAWGAGTRARRLVPLAAAGCLLWSAFITWNEVPVWRSSASVLVAAAERGPESYWVHRGQAYAARDAGRPDEAVRHFRMAADLFPLDWEMLTDGATVALAQRDTAAAVRWLHAAIAAYPRSVRARTRLASVTRARGDSAGARRLIEEGLRLDPEQRTWARMLGPVR